MTTATYYFYSYYNFMGRIAYAKVAGEPIVRSVNGGGKQRIKDKVEITEDQFNNLSLVDLQRIFFPDEANHGRK